MEKKAGGDGDKTHELGSEYDEAEVGGVLAIGAGGGIAASPVGEPPPTLPATPEHFVCLQGPCKHYWKLVTPFDAGNPASTWKALGREPPKKTHHTCLVNPGHETSFGETVALECNLHTPLLAADLRERTSKLISYYRAFPEHHPDAVAKAAREEMENFDADTTGTQS